MSDSDSFTSSSYTSYSDSLTYSDGSLTDSSDFDLLLATPDRAERSEQSARVKENNPQENKQDEEPVECARQFLDTSSNDLELTTEAEALEIPEKSLKSENMVSKRELLKVCCSLLDFGNQALELRPPLCCTVNILFA
ncbi:unnamed protein product [Oikopleura dioica]|uniref:Uncharacterized protein n=1 Tax=Oikopleura dioica TaxID=34765 RepID=E4Z343_OIKDI|nr:unnamed protein product [Oikopleura dioica]